MFQTVFRMHPFRSAMVAALVIGCTWAVTIVSAEPQDPPPYENGQIIVKLDTDTQGIDSSAIEEVNSLYGTRVEDYLQQLEIFKLSIDSCGNLDSIVNDIDKMSVVDFAHPNYMTDSLNSIQGSFPIVDEKPLWDLTNQWAYHTLALGEAHQYASGRGVTVAVIDGGVDYDHPVLDGAVIMLGHDYVDQDEDPMDEPGGKNYGHGTFIAGIIHLTAPASKILVYRVATPGGRCNGFVLAKAMLQAIIDGCQVIDLTFAMHRENGYHTLESVIEYARNNNVVVVAGAGNSGDAGLYLSLFPASNENVIAVSAIDEQMHLASFSHYGEHIDVCAPGVDIHSAFIDDDYVTATWSGTCFAASIVSGQAALIISRDPEIYTWSSVRNAILSTAEDLDKINPGLAGMLGNGCINPVASVSNLAWPDSFHFDMKEGCTQPDTGCIQILFPGDPTSVSAVVIGEPQFVRPLQYSNGDDELCFEIDAAGLPVGEYFNDLIVQIEGIADDSIVYVPVSLTVQAHDTVLISPDTLFFSALCGDCTTQYGESYLTSTNAPACYSGWVGATHEYIVTNFDTTGYTNDTVGIYVSPRGLDVGTHYADVFYEVDGFDYYVPLTVRLEISNPRSKSGSLKDSLDQISPETILDPGPKAQNYPNPFNPTTVICYDLTTSSHVTLEIFNLLGQRVALLTDKFQEAGRHQVEWNGRDDRGMDVATGVYLYRITAGSSIASEKMLLLR